MAGCGSFVECQPRPTASCLSPCALQAERDAIAIEQEDKVREFNLSIHFCANPYHFCRRSAAPLPLSRRTRFASSWRSGAAHSWLRQSTHNCDWLWNTHSWLQCAHGRLGCLALCIAALPPVYTACGAAWQASHVGLHGACAVVHVPAAAQLPSHLHHPLLSPPRCSALTHPPCLPPLFLSAASS